MEEAAASVSWTYYGLLAAVVAVHRIRPFHWQRVVCAVITLVAIACWIWPLYILNLDYDPENVGESILWSLIKLEKVLLFWVIPPAYFVGVEALIKGKKHDIRDRLLYRIQAWLLILFVWMLVDGLFGWTKVKLASALGIPVDLMFQMLRPAG